MEKGVLDIVPHFAGCVTDSARARLGPLARAFAVGISPSQYLLDGKLREVSPVPDSPVFGQEFGQRGTARKASITSAERPVHSSPGFPGGIGDGARIDIWPASRPLFVQIGPREYLRGVQGPAEAVRNTSSLFQQLG